MPALIRAEFRKNLGPFAILLTVAMLLTCLALELYRNIGDFSGDARTARAAEDALLALHRDDPAQYDALYRDYLSRREAYKNQQLEELFSGTRELSVFENRCIDLPDYGDAQLFEAVQSALDAPAECRQSIRALLRDAALRLQEEPDTDSYSYRYYLRLLQIYDPLVETDFSPAVVRGWNAYFSMRTPLIFLFLTLTVLLCACFPLEERVGMRPILRISRRGTHALRAAKLLYAVLLAAALSLLFTLAPLAIFALGSGLSDASMPVQALDGFVYFRYSLSIGQYLALYCLIRVLLMGVYSLLLVLIGQLTGDELPAFVLGALLALFSALCAAQPGDLIRRCSPFELTQVHILFSRFRGLRVGELCLDYTGTALLLCAGLAGAAAAFSLMHRENAVVRTRREHAGKTGIRAFSLSLLCAELHKQMLCRGGLYLLLAALLLKGFGSAWYYAPDRSISDRLYKNYMQSLDGAVTAEKIEAVREEWMYIESALQSYSALYDAYRNGDLSEADFREAERKKNYAELHRDACQRLVARTDYLSGAAQKCPTVEFLYDEGVSRMIGAPPDLIALLCAVFLTGMLFPTEYESGFSRIMRACPRGRGAIFRAKLLYILLCAFGSALLFGGADFLFLWKNFAPDYLSAPAVSIPSLADAPVGRTIGQHLLLLRGIRSAGFAASYLFAAALSALLEKRVVAMAVSALTFAIPVLVAQSGLPLLNCVSFPLFTAPNAPARELATYLITSAAAIAFLLLARRKWCGTSMHRFT